MTEPIITNRKTWFSDEIAYVAPMAAYLGTIALRGYFSEQWYPLLYTLQGLLAGTLLILFWKQYTRISWRFWWLGILVGVIGIVQWVGMQTLLERYFEFFRPKSEGFNHDTWTNSPALKWTFIGWRWLVSAVIIVPVMEELFWRDFLWRTIDAPNDFKLAEVGERNWMSVLIVSAVFGTVHGNWWLSAIVWAGMIAWLLLYTKSLGACIIAHAVTNLLLGAWVLYTKNWTLW